MNRELEEEGGREGGKERGGRGGRGREGEGGIRREGGRKMPQSCQYWQNYECNISRTYTAQ